MNTKKINRCRCCGRRDFKKIIDFGNMQLTTEFRKNKIKKKEIPMSLVFCKSCKLAQLNHSYDLKSMYNKNYGYESGINQSMKIHLKEIVNDAKKKVQLKKNDAVLDVASNDGTLLKNYKKEILKVGIDPILSKHKNSYPVNTIKIPNYFSKKEIEKKIKQKLKIITTVAVFYDIEDPNIFISDIKELLHFDGIWVLEQSYFLKLIKNNAYDSFCHEHVTYFCVRQIEQILKKVKLRIVDVKFNEMNGGSIRLFITHSENKIKSNKKNLNKLYKFENNHFSNLNYNLKKFKKNVERSKLDLKNKLKSIKKQNKKIHVYGASTKGNVILQYCGISNKDIEFASDRNKNKWGKFTPGSNIRIISEKKSRKLNPDYYLVMPRHFTDEFIKREKKFLKKGGKFLFPLPKLKEISF
jgi:hypothetical protein